MTLARKIVVGLSLVLWIAPAAVLAQANAPDQGAQGPAAEPPDAGPPPPAALDGATAQAPAPQAAPSQAAPTQPAPSRMQVQTNAPQQGTPPGQWVYTQQYGWLWMPYGEAYTHVPPEDQGEPYMYVYGPSLGWTWVAAPWVWGWGPYPYWGVYGPSRFAWYGWGPRWHGGYYGWRGGSYGWRGGGVRPFAGGWHGGARPVPSRPSVQPPAVSRGRR